MPVPNYWTWTKTTPQNKCFFWLSPCKIEIMITSFVKMLNLKWWAHWHKLWRHNLYFKIPLLSEGLISSKLQPYLLKQSLKTQKNLKESEIIYQNAIYICISWYSKVYWFPVKKYWCQQKAGITVPIFVIVGYLWHPWKAPKKSILNRV